MTLTMTDHFCGAGGSSEGAAQVPGVKVTQAANHWKLAIDTHWSNHPDTEHYWADLQQTDPRMFLTTDLAWFSPSCPGHSQARGVADDREADSLWGESLPVEAAARSRATMWDVVRFTEYHQYLAVIVENVVEVAKWGPNRNGQIFRNWLASMEKLGYRYEIVCVNSMHSHVEGLPAPQSRDRIYIVFTRVGDRVPDFDSIRSPGAHCGNCGFVRSVQSWKRKGNKVGRYRQQYVYRCPSCDQVVEPSWLPASSIIDWDLPGERVGDRARPLAEKTRLRIAAGIARYWGPIYLEAGGNQYDAADPKHVSHAKPDAYYRAWPVTDPLKVMHTGLTKGLAVPVEGREGKHASPVEDPLRTQTARNETGLAFVATMKGSQQSHLDASAYEASDPLRTVAASGNHHALVTSYYGTATGAKPVSEAVDTVTTKDRHGLVTPAGGSWNEDARPTTEPMRTLTTRESNALVMRNNTARGDQGQMSTPVAEPIRTLTTTGHQSLITAEDMKAALERVDEVYFRMFEPYECKEAMAFRPDYVMLGNKREQVRLAGNAVCPPSSRDIVACVVRAITGEGF